MQTGRQTCYFIHFMQLANADRFLTNLFSVQFDIFANLVLLSLRITVKKLRKIKYTIQYITKIFLIRGQYFVTGSYGNGGEHGHGHHHHHDHDHGADIDGGEDLESLIKNFGIAVLGKDQESADDVQPTADHSHVNIKALINELFHPSSTSTTTTTTPLTTSTQRLPIKESDATNTFQIETTKILNRLLRETIS